MGGVVGFCMVGVCVAGVCVVDVGVVGVVGAFHLWCVTSVQAGSTLT